ncbi:MAG: hypothetical protein ACRD15_09735 [Vicinamibacterales bacterium]
MTPSLRSVVLTLASVLIALPGYGGQKPTDADAKEIGSYLLTTSALSKVVNVNRTLVEQLSQDPRVREAMGVEAEIAAIEKKDEATEEDEKRLEALRARREELENSVDNPLGGDSQSLSEMEARIRKYPPLMQALQKEAMPPREYATFWMAFVQAAFVQGFKKSGMLKELPPEVNPENVRFIEDHAAEIEAMRKEFEALGKGK